MIDFSESELEQMWQNAKKINEYFSGKQGVSVNVALSEYIQHLTKLNNRINNLMKNYFITKPIYKSYSIKNIDYDSKEKLKKRVNAMSNDITEIIHIHKVIESLGYSEIIKANKKNKIVIAKSEIFQKIYDNFIVFEKNFKKLIKKITEEESIAKNEREKVKAAKRVKNDSVDDIKDGLTKNLNDIRDSVSSYEITINALKSLNDNVVKDIKDDIGEILGIYLYKKK
jgi:hypothetical protein